MSQKPVQWQGQVGRRTQRRSTLGPSLAPRGPWEPAPRCPAPATQHISEAGPAAGAINANHLAPAIWWPDTGQASSGTFHVTFLPPRLSRDEGLLPVALGDEKQAPGVGRGLLGTPASPGRGHCFSSHRAQSCGVGAGGVKAREGSSVPSPRGSCQERVVTLDYTHTFPGDPGQAPTLSWGTQDRHPHCLLTI